jgi:hypothetical protein
MRIVVDNDNTEIVCQGFTGKNGAPEIALPNKTAPEHDTPAV